MNLDMALTLINFVNNESYTMAKYYLKDMYNLTFTHTKECFKLVKQKIKNKANADMQTVNKAFVKGKKKPLCFHHDKPGYIKVNCFK